MSMIYTRSFFFGGFKLKSYYLSDGSKTYGPFNSRQVYQLLSENKISIFQLIFEDESQRWIQLYQHSDFTTANPQMNETHLMKSSQQSKAVQKSQELFLRSEKAVAAEMTQIKSKPVEVSAAPSALRKNNLDFWEVQTDRGISSPRTFLKMLEAIENNSIRPDQLIRKVGHKKWTQASLCDEFSETYIEKANNTELTQVQAQNQNMLRRKHERKVFRSQILLAADEVLEFHESIDVSLGGLAFLGQNSVLQSGDSVKVFLKKNQEVFANDFYLIARVVSKKNEGNFVKYAVQFEHIPYGFADWYNQIK